MKREVNGAKKAVRVTSIIIGVLLFIAGLAILGFMGWLGYQIAGMFGVIA